MATALTIHNPARTFQSANELPEDVARGDGRSLGVYVDGLKVGDFDANRARALEPKSDRFFDMLARFITSRSPRMAPFERWHEHMEATLIGFVNNFEALDDFPCHQIDYTARLTGAVPTVSCVSQPA